MTHSATAAWNATNAIPAASSAAGERLAALGDANDVTASVAAEVASRLATGRGTPDVYTPAELFGAELAEAGGGYSLATGS